MASFVLFFFPVDVLDEIWDLIESVYEGFLTYSSEKEKTVINNHITHNATRGAFDLLESET